MDTLFGVALNPFSTPVGEKIGLATDGGLASENWSLNMEICDMINETEDGPKDAVKAIRKRLLQNAGKNHKIIMYTLTVLETCVKNCGKRFHVLVCSKEFTQELIKLIGPKNDPPSIVQEKVLSLIQSWADAFRYQPDLQGVYQVYRDLKQRGIEFPMTNLDTMAPIHTPQKSYSEEPRTPTYLHHIEESDNQSLRPEQLYKLNADLELVRGNMTVLNEMLTELVPGKEDVSDVQLLTDLYSTCKAMQERIVELLSKLSDGELTEQLLLVNDDLNNLFLRYSRYEKNREAGCSNTVDNPLIKTTDLIQDFVDHPITTASNEFSKLSIGNETSKPKLSADLLTSIQSDFDMFAQSRSISYENTRTGSSSYDANLKPDQVNSLASLTQARSQNLTTKDDRAHEDVIRMHSEQDFDEIAAWLNENPGASVRPSGEIEESLSSSEFERFLAERAAAAENLSSNSNTTDPRHSKEKQKDPMFAL
ncbi:TOM1-like protein 2 [Daktulosphaira vitifoliae]|uniref:TOM1-like protein 2 n=1 Tax=Daktulosphaira vitifoliae TaxID=58002 RepID=UPI0021A9D4F9|nr:TOM1-like protein 2 [Daktulosphaira vitifoliae]